MATLSTDYMICIGRFTRRRMPVRVRLIRDPDIHLPISDYGPSLGWDHPMDTPIKYDTVDASFNETSISASVAFIIHQLSFLIGSRKFKRLSYDETRSTLDTSRSPGFPHVLKYTKTRQMFEDSVVDAKLRADFCSDRSTYVFTHSDKEEILRNRKNSRQISGGDICFLLKLKSFSEPFNNAMQTMGRGFPCMIGVSVTRGGWNYFGTRLFDCKYAMSLDATSFDSSVASQIYEAVVQVRCHFLDGDTDLLRQLYNSIRYKWLVDSDGFVFVTQHGTPSGQPNTAHDNTLAAYLMVLCFFYDNGFGSKIDDFFIAIYGDDIVIGCADEPLFSRRDIILWFYCHGMKLKCGGWQSPADVDFLSYRTYLDEKFKVYIPITTRATKLLTSMGYYERSVALNRPVKLQRMCSIRKMLYGTPEFDTASRIILNYIRQNEHMIGEKEWDDACRQFLHVEHIRFFLCGIQMQSMVILKSRLDKMPRSKARKTQKGVTTVTTVTKNKTKRQGPKKNSKKKNRANMQGAQRQIVHRPAIAFARSSEVKGVRASAGAVEAGSEVFWVATNSKDFKWFTWVLNPLNSRLFPKLQFLGSVYSQYRFESLRFKFTAGCTVVTPGVMAMSIQTDPTAPVLKSVPEMDSFQMSISGNVFDDHTLTYRPSEQARKWYSTNDFTSTDLSSRRQSAPGVFQLATQYGGETAPLFIGHLHVEYVVRFTDFKPPISVSFTSFGPAAEVESKTFLEWAASSVYGLLEHVDGDTTAVTTASGAPTKGQSWLLEAGSYIVTQLLSWAGSAEQKLPSGLLGITIDEKGLGSPTSRHNAAVERRHRTSINAIGQLYVECKVEHGVAYGRVSADAEWETIPQTAGEAYAAYERPAATDDVTVSLIGAPADGTAVITINFETINGSGTLNQDLYTNLSLDAPMWIAVAGTAVTSGGRAITSSNFSMARV